jgi:hypothetical protein
LRAASRSIFLSWDDHVGQFVASRLPKCFAPGGI